MRGDRNKHKLIKTRRGSTLHVNSSKHRGDRNKYGLIKTLRVYPLHKKIHQNTDAIDKNMNSSKHCRNRQESELIKRCRNRQESELIKHCRNRQKSELIKHILKADMNMYMHLKDVIHVCINN